MTSQTSAGTRQYFSNGQALSAPPFTVRVRRFLDESYNFAGLYLTTLFSLDAQAAAEQSPFNTQNRRVRRMVPPSQRSGGSGQGGGSGGNGGAGGGGGKKLGTVDDVRGPECKSCQG